MQDRFRMQKLFLNQIKTLHIKNSDSDLGGRFQGYIKVNFLLFD